MEIKKIRTYKPQNLSTDKKDNDLGKDKGKLDYKLSDEEKNARIKALDNASKKEIKEEVDEKQEATEKEIKNENIKQQDSPTKLKKDVASKPIASPEAEGDRNANKPRREEDAEVDKKLNKKKLSLGRDFLGRRNKKKLTIHQLFEDEERQRSMAAVKRARERERRMSSSEGGGAEATKKIVREVIIPEFITVQELANRMATRSAEVIKALMKSGVLVTANQSIDGDTAELVVIEFGHTVKRVSDSDVEIGLVDSSDNIKGELRAPIVTVMGHVDHGKTSLLDAIRSTDVVSKESGGITQHIGAYQIATANNNKITFIDTPGHAAFSAMRARGANVTDIIVLVVAADDSVMPQTIEAIQHAKAAKVPIVLAINKIDTQGANSSKVKQDLIQHEILTEDLGGDVVAVEVSATKRQNLDELVESILLQAELLDLKAISDGNSSGVVLETRIEVGRGIVSTLLVSRGLLQIGDIVVAGASWGKVRALINDKGERIDSAGPTVPVEILG